MKVKEAKSRISDIDDCKNSLERLAEKEKEPYFKDMYKCSAKMLEEYKKLLLDMIENAEIN